MTMHHDNYPYFMDTHLNIQKWVRTDTGYRSIQVCKAASFQHAEFIVRACNNHNKLVAVLEKFIIADENNESESDFFNKMTAAISEAKEVLGVL